MMEMIDTELLYLGGFGAVLALIIMYMMMKDSEHSKKVGYLEHSIDRLHNQLYKSEEQLKTLRNKLELHEQNEQRPLGKKEIEAMVKQEVKTVLEPISNALSNTELSMKEFQSNIQNRFDHVENHVKQSVMMPEISSNDEEKIVSMYRNGFSIDDIAKHFRIGAGEVELIVKFSDLT